MNISENNFGVTSGIPPKISKLKRLEKLDMSSNSLVGPFHDKICRLTRLKELRLDGNDLYGEVSEKIYKLVDLEVLSLDHNALTGEIPPKIKKLKKLERLWLGSNKFTGIMPVWLTKLKKLTTLDLHDNMLEGYLVPTLARLQKLEILRLDFNFFEGVVPRSYERLTGLVELDMGDGAQGNNKDLENLPVTLETLAEWRRTPAPPLNEELPYEKWLEITLTNIKGMRYSRRQEISQGEAHKLVRNKRAYEKAVLDSKFDNRTTPPRLRPLKLQHLFHGGAPTNLRNDGEGKPRGWMPTSPEEAERSTGWGKGYPTVLASELNEFHLKVVEEPLLFVKSKKKRRTNEDGEEMEEDEGEEVEDIEIEKSSNQEDEELMA